MSKCFNCGTEYEGDFCLNCGIKFEKEKTCPQCNTKLDGQVKFCNNCGYSFVQQPTPQKDNISRKISSFIQSMLKYIPIVLFVLWAGLLWVFYFADILADNLFGLIQGNLYNLLKSPLFEDYHSQLKVFIAFAVIADIYAFVYLIVQKNGKGKPRTFSHAICFILQLLIVIFSAILSGVIKKNDLQQGNFVAITIALTVVFAFLQLIALLAKRRFENTVIIALAKSNQHSPAAHSAAPKSSVNKTCSANAQTELRFALNADKNSYSVIGANLGTLTNMVIPAKYNGLPVTSIRHSAFTRIKITSITIPDSIVSIDSCAFDGCHSLESVYFVNPDGWYRTYSSATTNGTSISASDLSDQATAARYLNDTYCYCRWYHA